MCARVQTEGAVQMVKDAHEAGGVDSPFDLTFLPPSKFYHAETEATAVQHSDNASTFRLHTSNRDVQQQQSSTRVAVSNPLHDQEGTSSLSSDEDEDDDGYLRSMSQAVNLSVE